MKIVIVEDEAISRRGLVKIIPTLDSSYEIVGEAQNGEEGFELISRTLPDVVITDIMMPKLDGISMIEKLSQLNKKFIYIIVSGYAEFEYAKKGIQLGITDYLIKPVVPVDIENVLKKLGSSLRIKESDQNQVMTFDARYSLLVTKILKIIHSKYGDRIVLEELADQFGVTPEYLSMLFSKEVKVTFSGYLKIYRINEAKRMLLEDRLKIYEVAKKVGYDDPKYFCRVFKEVTGSPASIFVRERSES